MTSDRGRRAFAPFLSAAVLALAPGWPLATQAATPQGANPCATKNPCAPVNPCAAKNVGAAKNPCAVKDAGAAKNPCGANNPCAAKNPCAPKR